MQEGYEEAFNEDIAIKYSYSDSSYLTRFSVGKYLASGGEGSVFMGKATFSSGAEKEVSVKVLRPLSKREKKTCLVVHSLLGRLDNPHIQKHIPPIFDVCLAHPFTFTFTLHSSRD